MEDPKIIVIATDNREKALYIVARDAVSFDELEIQFTERYAPIVDHLLRILRKGFGWLERDRGNKDVMNTRCAYNEDGFCSNKSIAGEEQIKCNESVLKNCKKYSRRSSVKINVNWVLIEKAGQIKNL